MKKIIGIYKITSPTKRIYIGQSVDVRARLLTYKRLQCAKQPKLYLSLKKYGVEKHKFELVCECDISDLDKLEIYYIQLFNSALGKYGMNCVTGGRNGFVISEETRKKLSDNGKKRTLTEAQKKHLSIINTGKKHKPETIEKLREIGKKMVFTEEHRRKLSIANTGYKQSPERREKNRINGKIYGAFHLKKATELNKKKVIDTVSGIIYPSAKDAALSLGINPSTFGDYLTGARTNKTNCKYY